MQVFLHNSVICNRVVLCTTIRLPRLAVSAATDVLQDQASACACRTLDDPGCLFMFGFAVLLFLYGEPVAYRYFHVLPNNHADTNDHVSPTITLSPTIALSPTITNTPSTTDTPTITPTPYIPPHNRGPLREPGDAEP